MLGGALSTRLAEHSILDRSPSYVARLAMRQTAREAMTRLHFSQSLRRAELACPRTLPVEIKVGDIVYFWREQKYNPKGGSNKRKILYRRWRGPAMVIGLEGDVNCYVGHRGQTTKCAQGFNLGTAQFRRLVWCSSRLFELTSCT